MGRADGAATLRHAAGENSSDSWRRAKGSPRTSGRGDPGRIDPLVDYAAAAAAGLPGVLCGRDGWIIAVAIRNAPDCSTRWPSRDCPVARGAVRARGLTGRAGPTSPISGRIMAPVRASSSSTSFARRAGSLGPAHASARPRRCGRVPRDDWRPLPPRRRPPASDRPPAPDPPSTGCKQAEPRRRPARLSDDQCSPAEQGHAVLDPDIETTQPTAE